MMDWINSKSASSKNDLSNTNLDVISLQQLEFPKILEKLQSLLSTPYGSAKLDALNFSRDRKFVEESLAEVTELLGLLESGQSISFEAITDIRPYLEKLKPQEAYLEAKELLEIKNTFQATNELTAFFHTHQDSTPNVNRYVQKIQSHSDIINKIEAAIDRSAEIVDNATPELRQIRIKIRSLESQEIRVLKKIQQQYSEYSQDDILTLRDGRLVLGILPNFVNKINGIVHGTSSTGQTVFIEPMETLIISNEIQNLKLSERTEIVKILRVLSGLLRQVKNDISYGLENIGILDLIYAKTRLARQLNARAPKIVDHPYLKICEGRHPLLILKVGREKVVPLSLELGKDVNTLLITGPNAGGKTVLMKTIGLLILMTQMGMLIPADPDSEIPLFSQVLVDIGDRQSLEHDLSTFSAHIVRLKKIIENAGANSLVLLDEAGTGTDPKEGSALAIALLSRLTEKKSITVATTHHGELKAFAHEHPGVENGSMEFDLKTLRPTYRLRMGIPGSSYALEIARRYGLPESIIEQAKSYIGTQKDKLEDLILNMETHIQEAEKKRRELTVKMSQSKAMRKLYESKLQELKQNKQEFKRKAAEEAQKILQQANAVIERSVKEIKESQAAKASIKTARKEIQKQKDEIQNILCSPKEKVEIPAALQKGDLVWVESLNETGELLQDTKGKKKVKVLIGNVTLSLNVKGIRKSATASVKDRPLPTMAGEKIDQLSRPAAPELDIRGLDSEDAVEKTDRYLTEVLESDWVEVRIVHGKGAGVLRQRINQFLSKDKRVTAKRLGKWGEGDTGVTVVKLNKKVES